MELLYSLEEIEKVAHKLVQSFRYNIVLFYGDMGSGKTTLIKKLIEILGVADRGSSPTFSLINEYEGSDKIIYHMDLYRLKNTTEALDIGIEDYLYSGNYCFVEWPETLLPILLDQVHHIRLMAEANGLRKLAFV